MTVGAVLPESGIGEAFAPTYYADPVVCCRREDDGVAQIVVAAVRV